MIDLDIEGVRSFIPHEDLKGGIKKAGACLDSILAMEGEGSEMTGWLKLHKQREIELERITGVAGKIRAENDCLVVAGIGGSYLGARAAVEALWMDAPFPVLFAGNNLSPEYHSRLFDELEGKRFAVCVISKSGTTTEPALAFRLLREKLMDRFGAGEAKKRIIAVTDPRSGALRELAESEGITSFEIPPDVGGRFSVLTPVGLFPCSASGIPIREMVEGAGEAMREYTAAGPGNPVLLYAAIRWLLHTRGAAVEVLSTFHPELRLFCEWWKQLAGESEGKQGKGLFPASTVMTTDLHSLGQLLQEGTRDLFETFLTASEPRVDIKVPAVENDLDKLNYLRGRTLGEINAKAFEGTMQAHIAGGIPVISARIPSITPRLMGKLFVFFELAISVSGRLLGVNPFNQPGVDEYKTRMFRLLGKPGF